MSTAALELAPGAGAVERLHEAFEARVGGRPDGIWAAPAVVPLLGALEPGGGPALLTAVGDWALVAVRREPGGRLTVLADDAGPAPSPYLRRSAERAARHLAARDLEAEAEPGAARAVLAACTATPGTGIAVRASAGLSVPVQLGLAEAGLQVLLLDSGQRDVDSPVGSRYTVGDLARVEVAEAQPTPTEQRRRRHLATEDARVASAVRALAGGNPRALADLMTASHTSTRVDLRLSSVQVEATVGAALRAGALGARLAVPAHWGPVLALVPTDRVEQVVDAAQDTAARLGFPSPRATRPALGGGARRVLRG